ncbi:MAG: glycosyltransferase family 2 protein [Cyanobacteria bacterium J06581_3]
MNIHPLPEPSQKKRQKGWPWEPASAAPANGSQKKATDLPKITIITPSFNQAEFIEETIRSIILQGYPNLEYIVIDGGSSDGSVEIIKKYELWIDYWISEPDEGQSNALNKGFKKATGEILAWVNSDDTYEPGTLTAIGRYFASHPDTDVVYGNANIIDIDSKDIGLIRSVPFSRNAYLYNALPIPAQTAVFWRRELFFNIGMVNESLNYSMDCELIVKFIEADARFSFIREVFGNYRAHELSKTFGDSGIDKVPESHSIPQLKKVRESSLYPYIRAMYRVRQAILLCIQGDFRYLLGRASTKV